MTQRMAVDHRRTDTRDRILTVALRLFATQGYANTSLREIADELGVTKAALYFHFKTKEDILNGILLDHRDSVNAMIEEAKPYVGTLEGREKLLRRLADYQATRSSDLIRLVRENFTEITNLPLGAEMKEAQHRLLDALVGPDATVMDKVRARTAFIAVQSASFSSPGGDEDQDAVRECALAVALEVLRGCPHIPS
jgi:AcrR family transcriptional regulator